ncbi:MAG: hypothetical protein KGL39_11240 [Patescibacteria group bacterium]|nr:hypothetical protein [Patescibacteria group bacterium]
MTTWDTVAFIGMGAISIIMALLSMIISGLKDRLKESEQRLEDTQKCATNLSIKMAEYIHRSEWNSFQESQGLIVKDIFKAIGEIKDMLHTKQDKNTFSCPGKHDC